MSPPTRGTCALQRDHGLRTTCALRPKVLGPRAGPGPGWSSAPCTSRTAASRITMPSCGRYALAAARRGAEIHPYTIVAAVETHGGRSDRRAHQPRRVATPWSSRTPAGWPPPMARLAGVDVPLRTCALEAMVTEPLRPFLRPAVSSPHSSPTVTRPRAANSSAGRSRRRCATRKDLSASLAGARTWPPSSRVLPCARRRPGHAPLGRRVHADRGRGARRSAACPSSRVSILDCGWVYGLMGAPAAGALLGRAIVTDGCRRCWRRSLSTGCGAAGRSTSGRWWSPAGGGVMETSDPVHRVPAAGHAGASATARGADAARPLVRFAFEGRRSRRRRPDGGRRPHRARRARVRARAKLLTARAACAARTAPARAAPCAWTACRACAPASRRCATAWAWSASARRPSAGVDLGRAAELAAPALNAGAYYPGSGAPRALGSCRTGPGAGAGQTALPAPEAADRLTPARVRAARVASTWWPAAEWPV